jgi:hypothetical protein
MSRSAARLGTPETSTYKVLAQLRILPRTVIAEQGLRSSNPTGLTRGNSLQSGMRQPALTRCREDLQQSRSPLWFHRNGSGRVPAATVSVMSFRESASGCRRPAVVDGARSPETNVPVRESGHLACAATDHQPGLTGRALVPTTPDRPQPTCHRRVVKRDRPAKQNVAHAARVVAP